MPLSPLTLRHRENSVRRGSQAPGRIVLKTLIRNTRFRRFVVSCLVLFLTIAVLAQSAPAAARKIIFDTDPGTDDAMALMLALNSPELDVRAITVVPGNVTAQQGLENALRMVSLANRCDIPIAAGAQHPLFQKLITAEFWHGKNGLANVELPASKCKVDPRFGPDLIIQMVHAAPNEITLVPVGPLTNIALAVEKDPSIVPLVKEVIIMGGSITGGNVNAAAEANIYNDPEAAQIVFQAGWPLTMVGLDVGDKTLLGRKQLAQLKETHGPVNDFIAQIATYLIELSEKFGETGTPMYDPLAVGVAVDATLVTAPAMHVDVETRGDFTRGETVANRRGYIERNVLHGDRYIIEGADKVEPNAKVCTDVQAEKFLQLFVSRIRGK
ncbi:MAG TPA: nucleoside hydrolase [Terriglobales bacterium]|nr:nucleoside hydrolase [Terriglobales bacterium]